MFTLRDYQAAAKPQIRDDLMAHGSTIAYLATGGGKTVLALDIVMDALRLGKNVLFLAPRKELIDQPAKKLLSYGFNEFGCIKAGHPRDKAFYRKDQLQIASPQTMRARLGKDQTISHKWHLVVVDECHRDEYSHFLGKLEYKFLLGLTATPYRGDGRGLDEWFGAITKVATPDELTKMGRLKPMDLYWWPNAGLENANIPVNSATGEYSAAAVSKVMDVDMLRGDAIAHWKKYADGLQTLVFACSVEHAKNMVQDYEAAGIPATYVDGTMDDVTRSTRFQMFERGVVKILANYDICTTGYDCPGVEAIQLLRPVKSKGLWRQMLGRGTRPKNGEFVEDGECCVVLDHALCHQRFGHFTDPDRFSLKGIEKTTRNNTPFYCCPSCGWDLFSWPKLCPYCRAELPREQPVPREPLPVDDAATLVRYNAANAPPDRPVVTRKQKEDWAAHCTIYEGQAGKAGAMIARYRLMSGGYDPPPDILALARIRIVVGGGEKRVVWAKQFRELDCVSLSGWGTEAIPTDTR